MLPVFLYGDPCDTIGKELCSALSSTQSIIQITDSKVQKWGEKHNSLLICETNPKDIHLPCGIAVIKNKISKNAILNIPAHFPIIVSSNNKTALSMLKDLPHPIITCGMSVTDTISMSSKCEGSASVSVQRGFCDIFGGLVEECEIPIKLNCQISEYAISVAVAILLLCGRYKENICF